MMLTTELAHARLREAGMRLTPQRRAVIEVLAGDASHPRAEDVADEVARRIPGVSLSTVYKTLHEFADMGLVRELEGAGPMRFDPDASDHAHVVCDDCGTVADLEVGSSISSDLVFSDSGLVVSRVDIIVHATCPACSGGTAH